VSPDGNRGLGRLTPHPEAARRLRHALLSNGYDADGLVQPLRLRSMVGTLEVTLPWREVSGNADHLATLVELFTFGNAVAPREAEQALSPLSLDDAVRAGFLERAADGVRSPWEVLVHEDLLLLGDQPDLMTEGNFDFVGTISNSTRTLGYHTDRSPVAESIDLGAGSGVHALLAARHSDRVLAVDVNPRAIAITQVNAQLNELTNVECRVGDWFDCVEPGRRFGLVVANLPFVVAPEVLFRFAHSGSGPNELSRRLLREAYAHLADDGMVQILLSWTRAMDDDRLAGVHGFVDGLGCDAVVLMHGAEAADAYAVEQCTWLAPRDGARYRELLRGWLDYYRSTGIEAVEYGLVCLRRGDDDPRWVRGVVVPRMLFEQRGDHVRRLFAGNAYAETVSRDELLGRRFALTEGHRVTQTSQHRPEGYHQEPTTVELAPDVGYSASVPAQAAAVVLSMNEAETLGETTTRVAGELGLAVGELSAAAGAAVEDLLRHGMVVPQT
jgi:methylase of polypeptide subunit release factors